MIARKIKNGWCCSFVKPISELSISGGATPPEFAGEIHGTHRGIRLPLSEAFGTEVLSGSLGPDPVVLTGGEFWCFKRERLVHEALNISCWFLIWDLPITLWKARGLFWGRRLAAGFCCEQRQSSPRLGYGRGVVVLFPYLYLLLPDWDQYQLERQAIEKSTVL